MSRLTGNDALGLFEAYQAVYVPQELTEEQIWEEVENWVNSLLEEGYDLSEYTWEEMYEEYILESGYFPTAASRAADEAKYNLRGQNVKPRTVQTQSRPPIPPTAKPKVSAGAVKPGMLRQSFDVFDVIKGHLLDEGYADTEESALAIMANMSDEWVDSIVEMSDFEAGGGHAKIKKTGMDKAAVEALGKKNLAKAPSKATPAAKPAAKPAEKSAAPMQQVMGRKPKYPKLPQSGPASASDKFHMYSASKNRADDLASWTGANRKDPNLKKWADTNYRQNLALKTNDPKYDPTKTSYPEFTPAKKSSQSTWDTLGGKRG